jgi:hypothetical protein
MLGVIMLDAIMLDVVMLGVVMLCVIMLGVIMLDVIMLGVVMLDVFMPGVVMLGVVMLGVIMLGVVMLGVFMLNVTYQKGLDAQNKTCYYGAVVIHRQPIHQQCQLIDSALSGHFINTQLIDRVNSSTGLC